LYIIFNFGKLNTWYLQACGIFTLGVLFILPVLVLNSLKKIRNLNITNTSYKEILLNYYNAKQNLLKLQRVGIFLSFVLMFASSAVFAKIFGDKDFFMIEMTPKRYLVFGFAIAFVFICTRWGFKVYTKITNSAENVLNELE